MPFSERKAILSRRGWIRFPTDRAVQDWVDHPFVGIDALANEGLGKSGGRLWPQPWRHMRRRIGPMWV